MGYEAEKYWTTESIYLSVCLSLSHRWQDRNHGGLAYLINKPPRWNEQVGAYVLNFNGRVTMASVKNFQLVDPDEHNVVVLQVRCLLI